MMKTVFRGKPGVGFGKVTVLGKYRITICFVSPGFRYLADCWKEYGLVAEDGLSMHGCGLGIMQPEPVVEFM